MGVAELCIWNVRNLLRREKKKDGVNQVVDLKSAKKKKTKQKKKEKKKKKLFQHIVNRWRDSQQGIKIYVLLFFFFIFLYPSSLNLSTPIEYTYM